MKLSVVIATLGGDTLKETVRKINEGTVRPYEILICIPEEESEKLYFSIDNVKIIKTNIRGQVAQRACGFKYAKGELVLQIDDDILLFSKTIEQLIETISINKKSVVAPAMINMKNGQSVYLRGKYNPFVQKIYSFLMNGVDGYQPGTIDKAGTAIGVDVDIDESNKSVLEVEWLPGGCIMHYRENLVLEDFYPFKGKAFGEDVVHSYWLRKKGLSLFLDKKAKCELEIIPDTEYTFKQYLKNLYADYKVRKYMQKLNKKKSFRLYFFYIISFLSYCTKMIKNTV